MSPESSLSFQQEIQFSFCSSVQKTQLWKFWKISILSHLHTRKLLEKLSSVCHRPATSTNKQKQPNTFCPYSTNCAVAEYASLVPVFSCILDPLESCAEYSRWQKKKNPICVNGPLGCIRPAGVLAFAKNPWVVGSCSPAEFLEM